MTKVRSRLSDSLPILVLVVALGVSPARAQMIDRAAFEDLLGEPVTTSATGAPQRASDAPASMTIITGEELRRSGVQNLAEALRGRAGIDVMQVSANDYEVAVRGGNQPANPRLLVMVNGRQVYLDHYGLTSWTNLGIELSEIRQIEVVKGPVSALFGFNAASGAINIITVDPVSESVSRLSAEAGNDGQRAISAVGTLKLAESTGLRLSGGYARQDEYQPIDMPGQKPYRGNIAVDLEHRWTDRIASRINASYSDSRQTILVPGFSQLDMRYRVKSVQGELSADTGMGLLSLSGQANDLHNGFASPGALGEDSFDVHLFVIRAQDIFKAGPRDTIRATIEFRADSMRMTPDLAGSIGYNILSGGVMWNHDFSETVSLNIAARLDHLTMSQEGAIDPVVTFAGADFDQSRTPWSANAGLVIKPDAHSTWRLLLARGIQAPSLVSSGIAFLSPIMPGLSIRVLGNPAIRPTVTDSGEIGYSRDLSTGMRFSTTLFFSRTHDVPVFTEILPTVGPQGLIIGQTFANGGTYRSYGVEAAIEGAIGNALTWRLNYTFNEIDEDFATAASDAVAPFEELTPRHKIGGAIGYQAGPVSVDLRSYLRSKIRFPLDGSESGWRTRFDARVGVKLDARAELYAAGENIGGTDFVDSNLSEQPTRVRIGISVRH